VSELLKEWHWEITRLCNLHCRHCLTRCGHSVHGELQTSDALKAIESMASLGCTTLMMTGGEPLVRGDLFVLLESGFSHGISLGLLTNGFLVDEQVANLLSTYTKTVGISLDGASAKTHDVLRGQQSFRFACRAIKLLAASQSVVVYITVSALNIKEVYDIVDIALELGASRIHVSEITISGRAKDNSSHLKLKPNQRDSLRQMAQAMTGAGRLIDSCCNADLVSVYLSAEGLVYPCSEVGIQCPSQSLGRITQEDSGSMLLQTVQNWRTPTDAPCCYEIWAGKRITFYLNTGDDCMLVNRERRRP
jgi:MoaA/NifB/PqqE/SkfB family radical SAM enzyme